MSRAGLVATSFYEAVLASPALADAEVVEDREWQFDRRLPGLKGVGRGAFDLVPLGPRDRGLIGAHDLQDVILVCPPKVSLVIAVLISGMLLRSEVPL